MKQRGIGHVEVVLAFFLFVSALLFIISFFDIGTDKRSGEALLAYARNQVQTHAETTLKSYSIILKPETLAQQGNPSLITVELPDELTNAQHIRVEAVRVDGLDVRASRKHPTNLKQIAFDRGALGTSAYRVIVSEDFDMVEATFIPPLHNPAFFSTVSKYPDSRLLSEKKLKLLQEMYTKEYQTFREALELGRQTNVRFTIEWEQKDAAGIGKQYFIKAERAIPSRVDVTASHVRQELLLTTGERVFADVLIQVW